MKKILCSMLFVLGTATYAQVGIGNSMPNESTMLDITATNKGICLVLKYGYRLKIDLRCF